MPSTISLKVKLGLTMSILQASSIDELFPARSTASILTVYVPSLFIVSSMSSFVISILDPSVSTSSAFTKALISFMPEVLSATSKANDTGELFQPFLFAPGLNPLDSITGSVESFVNERLISSLSFPAASIALALTVYSPSSSNSLRVISLFLSKTSSNTFSSFLYMETFIEAPSSS